SGAVSRQLDGLEPTPAAEIDDALALDPGPDAGAEEHFELALVLVRLARAAPAAAGPASYLLQQVIAELPADDAGHGAGGERVHPVHRVTSSNVIVSAASPNESPISSDRSSSTGATSGAGSFPS